MGQPHTVEEKARALRFNLWYVGCILLIATVAVLMYAIGDLWAGRWSCVPGVAVYLVGAGLLFFWYRHRTKQYIAGMGL